METMNNKTHDKLLKGYILSISAILLFSVVLGLARDTDYIKQQMKSSYYNSLQMSRLGYISDDISADMRNLVLLKYMAVNSSSAIYEISLADNMSLNKIDFLSKYHSFLQGYSNVTGANISLSNSDPFTIKFNNSIIYSSALNGTSAVFKNSTGSTTIVAGYNITISAASVYANYTEWNWTENGTYISLRYSDPNGSFVKSGYINESVLNVFTIRYSSGNVSVLAGLIDGVANSVGFNQTAPLRLTMFGINTTVIGALPATYGAELNISYSNSNYSASLSA
ncbi:MAG: hypothetical protein QW112_01960 [Candidatus Micrarchaeia archaeon]